MEYIKQIIKNEVNKLDETEVDIFKKSIEEMFNNLIDSVANKHREIEKSIENSFKNMRKEMYFSSTLIQINELKYYGDVFYPIVEEKDKYSYNNILDSIKNNEKVKLGKLYFGNSALYGIDENKVFYGGIVSGEKTYDVGFKLTKFEGYNDEIKKLYKYSKNNFLNWTTPNMPFINFFYELELVEYPEELTMVDVIDDLYYNLEEYEGEYKTNMCPVWSIKKIEKINSKDSTLVSTGVHRYKTGLNNENTIVFINKNYKIYGLDYDFEGILELTVNKPDLKVLDYYLIENMIDLKNYNNSFPIWTNKKSHVSFLGSYSSFYNQRIRSLGEIRRILNSMDGAKDFILREVYVVEKYGYDKNIDTYEINGYITEDLRDEEKKDFMILAFQKDNIDNFTYGILSYITSEIQILFPEYKCIGEIEWII